MIISGVLIVLIVIIKSLDIHCNKIHISDNDETSDILIMGTTRSGKTRNISESFNFINYEQRKEENE